MIETLEELLAALDANAVPKARPINVPGLGDIHIRGLTIGEMDEQIADTENQKDKRKVARGACRLFANSKGVRILDPDNPSHVDKMALQPWDVLKAINDAGVTAKAEDSGN